MNNHAQQDGIEHGAAKDASGGVEGRLREVAPGEKLVSVGRRLPGDETVLELDDPGVAEFDQRMAEKTGFSMGAMVRHELTGIVGTVAGFEAEDRPLVDGGHFTLPFPIDELTVIAVIVELDADSPGRNIQIARGDGDKIAVVSNGPEEDPWAWLTLAEARLIARHLVQIAGQA
jgi:hypothetical protein